MKKTRNKFVTMEVGDASTGAGFDDASGYGYGTDWGGCHGTSYETSSPMDWDFYNGYGDKRKTGYGAGWGTGRGYKDCTGDGYYEKPK